MKIPFNIEYFYNMFFSMYIYSFYLVKRDNQELDDMWMRELDKLVIPIGDY